MTIHIRKCPGCKEERAEEEVLCGNCGWDLTLEPLRLPGQIDFIPETPIIPPTIRHCFNGHPLDPEDEMCFECGAAEAIAGECSETPQLNETVIDGWSAIDQLESRSDAFETFIVERHGHRALLTFYFPDAHPDSTIYEVIKRLPKDYVPELLAHGEWQGRRYEVTDLHLSVKFIGSSIYAYRSRNHSANREIYRENLKHSYRKWAASWESSTRKHLN